MAWIPVVGLDLLPDRAQVDDDLRADRVHRQVGEPGDRDAVLARLELDRLRLIALVGLRVGVEALSARERRAGPARRGACSGDGHREPVGVLLGEALELLEDDVEAVDVGLPERRAAGRGAGSSPAPAIIPRSISRTVQTPSSRIRQASTSAFSENFSTSSSTSGRRRRRCSARRPCRRPRRRS